jgi:hypothetical protein
MEKTGAGFVIDGAIATSSASRLLTSRAISGLLVPPAIHGLMVTGINVPVRIGTPW